MQKCSYYTVNVMVTTFSVGDSEDLIFQNTCMLYCNCIVRNWKPDIRARHLTSDTELVVQITWWPERI